MLSTHPEVRFIYRHYPLDEIHPNARLAAQAAEVANADGKFWQMHDALFEQQTAWAKITDKKELIDTFAGYAEKIEIDKAAFLERIESPEIVAAVQADRSLGESLNVQATPTFFVNGFKTTAPQLLATVESLSPTTASVSAEPDTAQ